MSVVRSDWEASIERYIRSKYPSLRIETNNRSIIPSRNTRNSYFELDIFIPELCLGIEANGETYHDREKYRDDQTYGTARSDEMYKENYCNRVGIRLIHVWSSDSMESIRSRIDSAIQQRMADPTVEAWCPPRADGWWTWFTDLFDKYGVTALLVLFFFVIPALFFINGEINESRQAARMEIQRRQAEAAAELEHQRQEEELRQEREIRDYRSKYDWWVLEHNDNVRYYNEGAPRRALKPFEDKLAKEIAAYPLGDVPDSCMTDHLELLSIVREFSAQLK